MNDITQHAELAGVVHHTQVNLGGLLTVLADNLYSTPLVALRELAQNAHDSCLRRTLETQAELPAERIRVRASGSAITIEDVGAGLTVEEMRAYLATIGASYTRQLRELSADSSLIGCFGLGFLSAFVIADQVTVTSTSYQRPDEAWVYQSRDGQSYLLKPAAARPVGTLVELQLKPQFQYYANDGLLREVLGRTCALLRSPVHIGGDTEPINAKAPWRLNEQTDHPVVRRKRRLAFASLFERSFEPITTIDVTPGDGSDVVGLLWLQDGATYGSSDNRNASAFVRGMLVDGDAKDLLPAWAGFVGGAIESDTLTPTASREDLQRDGAFAAAQRRIERCLLDGLLRLAHAEPESWRRVLTRHNEALRGACLCDDALFDALAPHLRLPTSDGDLTAPRLFERSADGNIYVSLDSTDGFEEMLCRALGVPMALGFRYATLPFLERWCQLRQGKLVRLGTAEGNRQLFVPAALTPDQRASLARLLGTPESELVGARFDPPDLPFVFVPNRDADLKARIESDEADRRIGSAMLSLARRFTAGIEAGSPHQLYINLNSPLIARLLAAGVDHPGARDAGRMLQAVMALQSGTARLKDNQAFRSALHTVNELLLGWIGQKDPQ